MLNVACSMERELANSEYFGLATRKFAATMIELERPQCKRKRRSN
jgi:hypothetical protein